MSFDPCNEPAYTVAEAARHLRMAPSTLRSWAVGQALGKRPEAGHSKPLFRAADPGPPPVLSFWNLVEAHVILSLRTQHGVSMPKLRDALATAEKELGIRRLLLSPALHTEGGNLLLEAYGNLIELSRSGQMAMKHEFERFLGRVDWADSEHPERLFPFLGRLGVGDDKSITIDPAIAFGRPFLAGRGITTATIVERIDAGESVEALAEDYDLEPREVEAAVVFEQAA